MPKGNAVVPRTVEVELSKTDVVRSQLQRTVRSWFWWAMFVSFATYVAWLGTWNSDDQGIVYWFSAILVGIFAALLWSMVVLPVLGLVMFARLKKGDGVVGLHKFTFNDDNIEEQTSANQSSHKWSNVQRISDNRSYIFIHLNGNQYHILPKRDLNDASSLLRKLHSLHTNAKVQH